MTKAAILVDGGYFLKRLRIVRPDVDTGNAKAVADSVGELVQSHLRQLNEIQRVSNHLSLLYRSSRNCVDGRTLLSDWVRFVETVADPGC